MSDELAAIPPPARAGLGRYLDCLEHWSGRINLTGAQGREAAIQTLIDPVLGAEALLEHSVIDVGSGNGSPGLILALLRPDLPFVLLEPRARRWAFLREAARTAGAKNVEVRRERSDAYRGEPAGTVTMRAVGLSPDSLRPLVRPGGCVLLFGAPPLADAEALVLPSGTGLQRRCFT